MKWRENWIWAGLVGVSILAVIFGLSDLLSAQREFDSSVADLSQCRSYAQDIRQLKQRPRLASMGLDSPEQTLRCVSQSMQSAGIDLNALISVAPNEPSRITASQYQLRSTELSLRSITLLQLADLAELITVEEEGSMLRDVILTASNESGRNASNAAETWDARLTLTQLIYSPTSQ